jgi:solute carrier family 50 protein (sugar transporter)
MKSILEGLKTMIIKDISDTYLLAGILNSCFWLTYSLKNNIPPLYICNAFLILVFGFYVNSYYYINKQTGNMIKYSIAIVASFLGIYFLFPASLAASVAVIINTVFYCTIMIKLKESMEKRNNEYINMVIVVVTLCGCVSWVLYGILTDDYFVVVPNAIGIVVYGLNILVYYWNDGKIGEYNILIEMLKKILRVEDEKTGIANNLYKIFRDDSLNYSKR